MLNRMTAVDTAKASMGWSAPPAGIGTSGGTGVRTNFNQLAKTRLIDGPAVRPTGPPGGARAG